MIHLVLYLEAYSDKRYQFLSRYLSQLFKHIMKQRTVSRNDKCHVFQPVSWDYQHVSWSLQSYDCWVINIRLTPFQHAYCFIFSLLLFWVLGCFLVFVCQLHFICTGFIPLAFFQFIAYLTHICFACRVVGYNTNV